MILHSLINPIKLQYSIYFRTIFVYNCRILTTVWSIFLVPFALTRALLEGRENPLHGAKLTGEKVN